MPHHPCAKPAHPFGYRPQDPQAAAVISVITVYQGTQTCLSDLAETLLGQSFQQWEWLIINDGVTHPLERQPLLALRTTERRIRVVDQPRHGRDRSRNIGVALAQAPFVFFLEHGSQLAPTAIEKLLWALLGHPRHAFASAWRRRLDQPSTAVQAGFSAPQLFPTSNSLSFHSLMYREAFLRIGGLQTSYRPEVSEWEFWARAASQGYWGIDVPEVLIWESGRSAPDPGTLERMHTELQGRFPALFAQGPVALPTPMSDPHPQIERKLLALNRLVAHGQRRVLLVLPSINPGGGDQFALDLVEGLLNGGDRVSVVVTRKMEQRWLPELQRLTSDCFVLSDCVAPGDIPRFLHYLVESRSITHILTSMSLLGYELLAWLRATCPQVALVDFVHAAQEQRHGGFARVSADHDELLDLRIVTSHSLRDMTITLGATLERTEVCYIGANAAEWKPDQALRATVRAELGIAPDMPVILYAARLSAEKRPDLAVEIMRQVRANGTEFVGLIAGDGESAVWLRWLVLRHQLHQHVRLLGGVTHTRIRELMAAADLFLLPSEREGIALTVFEAMASGVVPVAAAVGGQHELVTPDCGILIQHGPHEVQEYVAALRRFIEEPALRQQYRLAARERIEELFDLQAMPDRMRSLLDEATEQVSRPGRAVVPFGAGYTAATLAIEHNQLEERLRHFLPIKLALWLRWSAAGRTLGRLRGIQQQLGLLRRKARRILQR